MFCVKTTKIAMHKDEDAILAGISHDNSHSKVTTKRHYCTMLQRVSQTDKKPP